MTSVTTRTAGWLLLLLALIAAPAVSAQSGGGYDLSWHTVDGGGVTFATGGTYTLGGTAGQPDAGRHAGGTYSLSGGFWFAGDATFTVTKDFSDNSTASVTVTLTCDAGVVTPASALASEAAPAIFTISSFKGTPTCTATETVPAGYTADQSACAGVALASGTCAIVNTLNVAAFSVAKDFSDNNPAGVSVSLACTSGAVTPASALASEAAPAVFSVSGFSGTPTCTASETVPPGYTANVAGCSAVALASGTCTIVNTLNSAAFTVAKDFSDDSPAAVTMSLSCTSGTVAPASAPASEATPATFTVTGFSGAPACTATETVPAGYTANQAGCSAVSLAAGTCTIVNTLNAGSFTVRKDFNDGNPASVTVALACTSGTVSPPSAPASEASPAVFSVTGFSGTPSCTATETAVPAGYAANQAGCAAVALASGTCTIVNTALPGTITIVQRTVPSPDTSNTPFAFTAGGGLVPTSFVLRDGQSQVFSGVAPGSGYSVSQLAQAGWMITSATCSDGSAPTNIVLDPNESITCTFTSSRVFTPIPATGPTGLALLALALSMFGLMAVRVRRRR